MVDSSYCLSSRKKLSGRLFLAGGHQLPGYLALSLTASLAGPRVGIAQHRQRLAPLAVVTDPARPVYPQLRPLVIQSGLLPARRVMAQHNGVNLADTKALLGHQLRLAGVAPVLIAKPVVLLVGVNYLREQGGYSRQVGPVGTGDSSYSYVRQDLSVSLSAIRRDSLFHRPVTYLASVTGMSRGVAWPEKFVGGLTVLLTLRNTAATKLSAGLSVQLNPSSNVPVAPVLSYWHRFARSAWEVDLVLPARAHLRRPLLANKGWLSLGADLMSTHSFGSTIILGPGNTFEANIASIQTGALFEFAFHPYLMLGIRGGLDTPISMWVGEKNSSYKTVKAQAETAAYFGLNLAVTVPVRKR